MNPIKTDVAVSNMVSKGFRPREGDHTFLVFYKDGKKTCIFTKVSHGGSGGRELDDHLIHQMAKQD